VFEKRKRRKAAERRFDEAIQKEWERQGVVPRGPGPGHFAEALREAGLPPVGNPNYTRLALDVVNSAAKSLSPEDQFIITQGREGKDS
jgi:hypothetical protein